MYNLQPSVFVKFRVTFYSNFVFVSSFLVIRGRGSGRGWCCPDPPHLSASHPDWGWPSPNVQLQPRSWCILEFVYPYRLVTVRWCPLSVWKAPLLSPGVASEAGHLSHSPRRSTWAARDQAWPKPGVESWRGRKEIASTYVSYFIIIWMTSR